MASSRPFGYDPLTGGKQTVHFDDDGKVRIVKETDVESVLRANYDDRMQSDATKWGDSWEKDGQAFIRFARIPLDIYYNENILPRDIRNDPKELMLWLQRPEQEPLRARFGKFV